MAKGQPEPEDGMQNNIKTVTGQTSRSFWTKIGQKQGDQASKEQLKMYIFKRIQAEVIISQKIKHPNIVEFIYFTETSNNLYIFMERCQM